jgi:hypothetical protein
MGPGLVARRASGLSHMGGDAMAFTKADLENEGIEECGPFIAIVGGNALTKDGTNAFLEGPIRRAIERSGGSIADPPRVSDSDVATVTGSFSAVSFFLKLFILEKCRSRWAEWDQKQGNETQNLSDLREALDKMLDDIAEQLKDPETAPGVVTQDIGVASSGIIEAGTEFDPRAASFPIGW